MPADAAIQLQASVTKTASFSGTGLNLPSGVARRGMYARVIYSAATNASGSNSVTFSVSVSKDNSTYYQKTVDNEDVINLSTTAQSGEIYLPFETGDPYVRADVTIAGAGSTPTVTYQVDIVPVRIQ